MLVSCSTQIPIIRLSKLFRFLIFKFINERSLEWNRDKKYTSSQCTIWQTEAKNDQTVFFLFVPLTHSFAYDFDTGRKQMTRTTTIACKPLLQATRSRCVFAGWRLGNVHARARVYANVTLLLYRVGTRCVSSRPLTLRAQELCAFLWMNIKYHNDNGSFVR